MRKELYILVLLISVLTACASTSPCRKNGSSVVCLEDSTAERNSATADEEAHPDVDVIRKTIPEPPVPLRTPDKVIRIYLLPYTDRRGNLMGGRYIFTVVEDGEWVISTHRETEGSERFVNPITPLTPQRRDKEE